VLLTLSELTNGVDQQDEIVKKMEVARGEGASVDLSVSAFKSLLGESLDMSVQ